MGNLTEAQRRELALIFVLSAYADVMTYAGEDRVTDADIALREADDIQAAHMPVMDAVVQKAHDDAHRAVVAAHLREVTAKRDQAYWEYENWPNSGWSSDRLDAMDQRVADVAARLERMA